MKWRVTAGVSFERRWALLDAFIIEEIKRREQEREQNRPRVDLPLPEPTRPHRQNDERPECDDEGDGSKRGVIIIDYSVPAA